MTDEHHDDYLVGQIQARVTVHHEQIEHLFEQNRAWQEKVPAMIHDVHNNVNEKIDKLRSEIRSVAHDQQVSNQAILNELYSLKKQPKGSKNIDLIDAAKMVLLLGLLIGAAVGAYYQGSSVIASSIGKVLP